MGKSSPSDLPEPAHGDHPAGDDDGKHTTADPSGTPPASDEPIDSPAEAPDDERRTGEDQAQENAETEPPS